MKQAPHLQVAGCCAVLKSLANWWCWAFYNPIVICCWPILSFAIDQHFSTVHCVLLWGFTEIYTTIFCSPIALRLLKKGLFNLFLPLIADWLPSLCHLLSLSANVLCIKRCINLLKLFYCYSLSLVVIIWITSEAGARALIFHFDSPAIPGSIGFTKIICLCVHWSKWLKSVVSWKSLVSNRFQFIPCLHHVCVRKQMVEIL